MSRGRMISSPTQCTQHGQRGRNARGEMTCPRPYGKQVAEPSKAPGAAVQSLQASLTPSRKATEESQGCCPCRPRGLLDPKAPGPVSHCGMLQQPGAVVFLFGTMKFLPQRTSPNYSVKQEWQNSLLLQGNNCGI